MNEEFLHIIVPTTITDAMVISNNAVDEADPYSAIATYDTDDQATFARHLWRARVDGVIGVEPGSDDMKWEDLGASNKWAMLDGQPSTATTRAESLTLVFDNVPQSSGLALLGIDGLDVSTKWEYGAEVLSERELDLWDYTLITDIADLFFNEPVFKTKVAYIDAPRVPGAKLTVTINKPDGIVSLATLVVGLSVEIGSESVGLRSELVDYSSVFTNVFGNIEAITQRGTAEKFSSNVLVPAYRLDAVKKRLKQIASTPVVVVGGAGRFDSMLVYGLVSHTVDIDFYNYAHVTVEVKERI